MRKFDLRSAGYAPIPVAIVIFAYVMAPYREQSLTVLLAVFFVLGAFWLARAGNNYKSFVRPVILVLAVLLVVPMLFTLALSVFAVNGINLSSLAWPFAGWDNFQAVISSGDEFAIFVRTLVFAITAVSIEMLLGLAGGMLLYHTRAGYLVRSLLVLPVVIPPLIAGMLWRSMFDSGFGLFNRALIAFGMHPVAWLAIGDQVHPSFFANGLAAPIAAEAWQWTPFVALVVSVALAQQPPELAAWAKTQSGNRRREFFLVSLPQLAPVLLLLAVLRTVDCLKAYDAIWAMYGNNIETATTSVRITTYALEIRDFGVGSAISVLFLIVVTMLAAIGVWPMLRRAAAGAPQGQRAS